MRARGERGESRIMDAVTVAAAVVALGVVATMPRPEPSVVSHGIVRTAPPPACSVAGPSKPCERDEPKESARR